ncbi:hypothetical protein MTO96_043045, partial [Rhipicephalus appendiculatus]
AGAIAAKQHAASRSEHAEGKNAPSIASKRVKQFQWRPRNTPRIEKDDIIVVLKPRETLALKATFGPGQAGAAVRSIIGADASVGLAVWPIWDQNVLVCTLKSVDAAEKLLRDVTLLVGGPPAPIPGTSQTLRSKPKTAEGQAPAPRTGPTKAPAAKPNKPEPKKPQPGSSATVKSGNQSRPPCTQGQGLPALDTRPTTARKIQELEAKHAESLEPVQGEDVEEGDDGSSVISCLTSVSRQGADTVVGSVSAPGHTGRLESLERKTEQLEERVAALPNQIMSAVRESFQDMFMAALTQALLEIVAQVSDSVLKAVQPWITTQIKNTTQCDPPQLKRKTASRQAVEESCSGTATGGPARLPAWSRTSSRSEPIPRTVK